MAANKAVPPAPNFPLRRGAQIILRKTRLTSANGKAPPTGNASKSMRN